MKEFAVDQGMTGQDLKNLRIRMGYTQEEFARLSNVAAKTLERWEYEDKKLSGPIVTLAKILREYPQTSDYLQIPEKEYPMRLWYMCGHQICTIIDVDERKRKIKIHNYTYDKLCRAFGSKENPDFQDYEEFLESRCFPRTRDKMKIILEELGLPFYDPFLIVEKTQGRMAGDNFWIRIER